jgi:hypothetical protein
MNQETIEVRVLRTIGWHREQIVPGKVIMLEASLLGELLSKGLVERTVSVDDLDAVEADIIPDPADPIEEAEGLELLELKDDIEAVLIEAGLDTIEKVQKATKSELVALPKIGEATAKAILAKSAEFIVED